MIFAVDFDGTIVEHKFPDIGSELPEAINTLLELQDNGHKIIIWTCRCGSYIGYMIEWLNGQGFEPNAVNSNVANVPGFAVPKVLADIYIDDRNLGGFPGWDAVRKNFLAGQ